MSTLTIILLIVLVAIVLGGYWGHTNGGYPVHVPGVLGLVVVVLLILALLGKI